jgi:hypothetical protein
MKNLLHSAALLLCLTCAAHATSDTIPSASGTALDGHTISLPRDLNHATILILGFSKNSADATTAWEKPIRLGLASPPSIGFYDMPFLQDAPSLLRPLIVRSIRKQVPDALKPNFVPLTTGESNWKQLTNFSPATPDAAYVLLVDRNGKVLWQTHEAFTQARFDELSAAARKLAAETH